jgi:hypothetical protein
VNEDFNKNTATKSGWKINDFSKPIILVIKKNVTTLTALHKWLKDLNARGDGRISDVPTGRTDVRLISSAGDWAHWGLTRSLPADLAVASEIHQ